MDDVKAISSTANLKMVLILCDLYIPTRMAFRYRPVFGGSWLHMKYVLSFAPIGSGTTW
jgi:hypothetical protein